MAKFRKKRTFIGLLLLSLLVWAGCSQLGFVKKSDQKSQTIKANKTTTEVETKKAVSIEEEEKEKDMGATYVEKNERREKVTAFCQKIEKRFTKYGWGKSKCMNYPWNFVRTSVKGDPLIWMTFGNETEKRKETTLILCGVHGDEITPIKFCFDILDHMNELALKEDKEEHLKDRLVLIAPIVNPDSFLKKWPTRTNANGVDVNRNFPTRDFKRDAIKLWKNRYKKDKRRYPGTVAMSEPETLFQVNLLKRYGPDKIISVHAPLTMLDYDGPADRHAGGVVGSSANQLLMQMSEQAKGYKIKNYPFFPGSLGNYAGNERNIPTYTLELPSSDNRKSKKYWRLFKDAIHSAIMHTMDKDMEVARDERAPSDSLKQN